MIRLYEATQINLNCIRGIILWDEEVNGGVMMNNPEYRLGDVVASAPTISKLRPFVDQWKATAARPEAPEAKYATLATDKNGKLRFV